MFGKMQNAMFGSGKQSGPDMGMGPPGGGSPVMGGGAELVAWRSPRTR